MLSRWFLAVCFCIGLQAVAVAQKTERVTATYTYYAPEHVSIEEARRVALQRAQLQAIADAFGTIVTQTNATTVRNENGKSDVSLLSLGASEVKGEWLRTDGEPEYEIAYEDGMLAVTVRVKGVIREIVTRRTVLNKTGSGTGMTFTCLSSPRWTVI